jgi:hypothetical protein
MSPKWQPEVVEEPDSSPEQEGAAFAGLMLALKALSQRALVALEACFTLVTVLLVWALWWRIIDEPSTNQIAALSLFAAFVLLANVLVLCRRRK